MGFEHSKHGLDLLDTGEIGDTDIRNEHGMKHGKLLAVDVLKETTPTPF